MEKSWVTELQEDCLCQEIIQFFSFKKRAGNFYITEIYVFGTGSSQVSIVLFCACCLEKMLNLRSFTACLFSFNPSITERKKLPTFTELGTFCTHIFKIIFSTLFFQGSINRLNCSQNFAFIQTSHFSCTYIE